LHKYYGPLHVIKGVNLDIRPGEIVVIMGPSGSGKTTFLRCLILLDEPSDGWIEIDGLQIDAEASADLRDEHKREIRQKVAMVFQESVLFPHMTVLGNIIVGAVRVAGVPKTQAISKAEELLAELGLSAKSEEYPSGLVSEEQQQVAIARALCMEPKIILFDDPTSVMDSRSVTDLVDLMARLAGEEIAMIVVTNEPRIARNAADWVVLMEDGRWVEIARPDEFFTHPRKERTRQFVRQLSLKDIGGGL
jgi:ABC-type polar amino acid transport system ATPase subunit